MIGSKIYRLVSLIEYFEIDNQNKQEREEESHIHSVTFFSVYK
jgi:hypothetical protein